MTLTRNFDTTWLGSLTWDLREGTQFLKYEFGFLSLAGLADLDGFGWLGWGLVGFGWLGFLSVVS